MEEIDQVKLVKGNHIISITMDDAQIKSKQVEHIKSKKVQ